jgi:hypothetical protein
MNKLPIAVAVATLSSLIGLAATPAHAAILTNGGNFPYGGEICAEMPGASTVLGTPIEIHGCHGYANQQWYVELGEIFGLPASGGVTRCMGVLNGGTKAGSPVVVSLCTNAPSEQWTINALPGGQIVNRNSHLCLDATTQAEGVVLVTNPCAPILSQYWQVK